ncbi:MAG: hypothetical protein ACTSU5_14370 [Promethearchaeota archaeon]
MNRVQLVTLGSVVATITATMVVLADDALSPFYQYFGWFILFTSFIIKYTKVVLLPLGIFMQDLISRITPLFADSDIVYYVIFAAIVVAAFVVNLKKPERTVRG